MSSSVPKHCGTHSMTCSGVPLAAMPAAARPEPKIDSAMPASPQNSSSSAMGMLSPVGSAMRHVGEEVEGVEPDLGGLLDDGPGELLLVVPLLPGGTHARPWRTGGPSPGAGSGLRSVRARTRPWVSSDVRREPPISAAVPRQDDGRPKRTEAKLPRSSTGAVHPARDEAMTTHYGEKGNHAQCAE